MPNTPHPDALRLISPRWAQLEDLFALKFPENALVGPAKPQKSPNLLLTPTITNDPRAYAKKLLLVAPLVAQMDTRGSLAHAVRINGVEIEIYGVVGEISCSQQ